MEFIKRLFNILYPAASVWINLLILAILQKYSFENSISILMFLSAFAVILAIESLALINTRKKNFFHIKKWRIALGLSFWTMLFVSVVISMPKAGSPESIRLLRYSLLPTAALLVTGEAYVSLFFAVFWAAIYYLLTVRKGELRLFTSFVLPNLILYTMFCHFYYSGGPSSSAAEDIIKQPGVHIFYSNEDFPRKDYNEYMSWTNTGSRYPRKIIHDKINNKIYALYAKTYGKGSQDRSPRVLRIDMDSRETEYFTGYYSRAMCLGENSVFISPWFENSIFAIDKRTMKLKERIPSSVELDNWESVDLLYDSQSSSIFLSNEIEPVLLKYDISSYELLNILKPEEIRYGGVIWNMHLSKKSGFLYVTAAMSDKDLYEIDTKTMEVRRTLALGLFNTFSLGASSMDIADETGCIYIQSGGSDDIFEININSFEVTKKIKGALYARKLLADTENKVIYILDYLKGRLICTDLVTGEIKFRLKTGAKPSDMFLDGRLLYFISASGIFYLDTSKYDRNN